MQNPYQDQIDVVKSDLMSGLELAREFKSDYTDQEFAKILVGECHKLNIKVNAIIRSGGHPSDDLRVQFFCP